MDKKNIYFIALIFALTIPLLLIDHSDTDDDREKLPVNRQINSKEVKVRQARKKLNITSYRAISHSQDEVPESIQPLFKLKTFQEQINFVLKLSNELNELERDALYMFLRNDENYSASLHIKDEIMCKLEAQTTRPPEYEQALYSIMKDDAIDGDLRGYAVQHLRSAYSVDGADKSLIKEALFQALEDTQSDVSGTAMLAFSDPRNGLIDQDGEDSTELDFIKKRALELAADESLHVPSRNTIIECCGRLGIKEIIPIAREIIEDQFKTIADKLPAIAAIGHTGDESHIPYLQKMSKNKRLAPAANGAIKRIQQRKTQ